MQLLRSRLSVCVVSSPTPPFYPYPFLSCISVLSPPYYSYLVSVSFTYPQFLMLQSLPLPSLSNPFPIPTSSAFLFIPMLPLTFLAFLHSSHHLPSHASLIPSILHSLFPLLVSNPQPPCHCPCHWPSLPLVLTFLTVFATTVLYSSLWLLRDVLCWALLILVLWLGVTTVAREERKKVSEKMIVTKKKEEVGIQLYRGDGKG